MRLADFIEVNPRVEMEKGLEFPFIAMEEIEPSRRYVYAQQSRIFEGGGARFRSEDTLFARITPCLENGKIAQFNGADNDLGFGSTEFIVLRARPSISDPAYIYYLARTDAIRGPAEKSMSGASGRQRVNVEVVKSIEIVAPPLPVQARIASVLSAYDDLIDNNLRRIRILEEIAQLLYRKWFISFLFPGHQKARKSASRLGHLPEGWEARRFTDAIAIDPSIRLSSDQELPFVAMEGLSTVSMLVEASEFRRTKGGSKFQNGDTLFARITPCLENGKTGFVQFLDTDESVGIGSTEFIVFRSKTLSPEFVYLLARSDNLRETAIKSMTGASGRQRVQKACFEDYFIPHPPSELLVDFTSLVRPIFSLVQNLSAKNKGLRQARDLLLPKLVSNQIDISDLDIKVAEDLG